MSTSRRILYAQYTNPGGYTILGHGARILAARGWHVRFLGIGARGNADALTLRSRSGIEEESLRYCSPGVMQKIHYLYYCIWVCLTAVFWRANVVYCSEKACAPIGLFLTCVFGTRIIYHEHDPANNAITIFDRALMICRSRLAKKAIACVIPNSDRLEHFIEDVRPKKSLMVWNAVSLEEVEDPIEKDSHGPLQLWYQGALGPTQLPLTIVDAIAETDGVEFSFVGYGSDDYAHKILSRAKSLGVSDRVHFCGTPCTRIELYAHCRNKHVGLALFEIPFRDVMAGASQKPFEYMAAGMALMVPDIPEWHTFAIEPGFGIGCLPDNISDLTNKLRYLRDNRLTTMEMGKVARNRVLNGWNYESLFKPVVDIIEQE